MAEAKAAPTYAALSGRMRAIQERLLAARRTVASAESCTGGLLSAMLTEHGGSSGFYLGGAAVYSNGAKTTLADVPPQLIHSHGAVSSVVAAALARGSRERLGADIGLGITGIAGPAGATPGRASVSSTSPSIATVTARCGSATGDSIERAIVSRASGSRSTCSRMRFADH